MDVLYRACSDALDTYLSQIAAYVFKVQDVAHDTLTLSWRSGHKEFSIHELDKDLCRQLGIDEWPAMSLLIDKSYDDVTQGAVTIVEGKVDQQTRSADRLYVCTKNTLHLFAVTRPAEGVMQKIDPTYRTSLPAEAANNLANLVLRGHIIL